MGEKQINWEDLGIANDFMFGKVMQNPRACKKLLERILPDLKIDRIEYPELQKGINPDMEAKGIRLDVYVKDNSEVVYNIEMQASSTSKLPKRSRYYQRMIDLQLIDKGQKYNKLNRTYIIFICLKDIFGKGRHMYTFENICKEDKSISMGDETTKIFLNANGKMDDVSKELKAFLDYAAGRKTDDSYVQELDDAVKEAKKNRKWRHEYMTLLMRDEENREIGEKIGEDRMSKLVRKLTLDKRFEDILIITEDKEYRKKLYKEYQIN